MTIPSFLIAYKIADFFGVALEELLTNNIDKAHVTVIRFKKAEKKLGSAEFNKIWHIGKKIWDLLSNDDKSIRKKNVQHIESIADLLNERELSRQNRTSSASSFPK